MDQFEKKERPISEDEVYDEEGRITDPEIAREMADVEGPYREKRFFGTMAPSKKNVREGERAAELRLKDILSGNLSAKRIESHVREGLEQLIGEVVGEKALQIERLFMEIREEVEKAGGMNNLPPEAVQEIQRIDEEMEHPASVNHLEAIITASSGLLEMLQRNKNETLH